MLNTHRTLGIELSKYQDDFDWPAVFAEGVRFSTCRASEGTTHVDPRFEEHLSGATAAGLLTGSFHFFRAHKDPELQARHYFDVAGNRTHLPPAIAFETLNGVSGEEAFARARLFIAATEALWDRQCIVYTCPAFWHLLGDPSAPELGARPLWIAHYATCAPTLPRPWTRWTFLQFDGDGGQRLADGVDADFHWFDGTEEDLRDFCRSNEPTLDTPDSTQNCAAQGH